MVGPVQAEVFLVWRDGGGVVLTGPCGADPWYLQLAEADDPVEVVDRTVTDVVGPPRLVHSTSWRRERGAVVLTFLVVIDPAQVGQMASVAVPRSGLARSHARTAPAAIDHAQVLEHALRHLAWLAGDDPVVAGELDLAWRQILAGYTPEPFRALG